ncbi:MAG: NUDIX domain-containing protein [Pseudomonadota bacterium]
MAKTASDLPRDSGLFKRLHYRIGRLSVIVSNLTRPRLSLGVRVAAFDRQGRVFLVRHSYVPGYYLPGGGVEARETCLEAAVREAQEEGALIFERPPSLYHIYRNQGFGLRDHVVLFVARNVSLSEEPHQPNNEIVEAGFYPLTSLPEDTTQATLARIAEIQDGSPRSDDW